MADYDGTNAIFAALGDAGAVHEVTAANRTPNRIIEPVTRTRLAPGETTVLRIKGDLAAQSVIQNLEQIGDLNGGEGVDVSFRMVEADTVATATADDAG